MGHMNNLVGCRGHQVVGSSSYILKGYYLLFLLPTHYPIPSLSTILYLLSMLYCVGCSFFIFLCVLGWKRVREVGIEPTETVPTYRCCAFVGGVRSDVRCDPCGASPLARDAHPFALTLQSTAGAVFLAPG